MQKELSPRIFEAPDMRDGDVRLVRPFGDDLLNFHMTWDTWAVLVETATLGRMYDSLASRPEGVYPLPRAVMEPAAAEDLRNTIALGAEPSEDCVMAGCLQPVVSTERGFSVCQIHDDLLQDWDSLVA